MNVPSYIHVVSSASLTWIKIANFNKSARLKVCAENLLHDTISMNTAITGELDGKPLPCSYPHALC